MAWLEQRCGLYRVACRHGGRRLHYSVGSDNEKEANACMARLADGADRDVESRACQEAALVHAHGGLTPRRSPMVFGNSFGAVLTQRSTRNSAPSGRTPACTKCLRLF